MADDLLTSANAARAALQQRVNIADQRVSNLTWLAKSAYSEGLKIGWAQRHTDANNERRVTPGVPPFEVMDIQWLNSDARANLHQATSKI
jgi:hypothetical protein